MKWQAWSALPASVWQDIRLSRWAALLPGYIQYVDGMFTSQETNKSIMLVKSSSSSYGLVGLVVRRPPREWKIPGSNPACDGMFSGSSHTSGSKIGTPVATLPDAWCYRVSAGTGQPGVSILWLGEVESLICNFCLSVAARKIVWADLSLRYTSMLLGR